MVRHILNNLTFASLTEVAKAIKEGQITSLELTEHMTNRIEKFNPDLNAIVTFTKENALTRAHQADKALSKGSVWGPLHGIPITIKDCFEVSGVRTTAGSKRYENYIPEKDATAVLRLKNAGAIILGKTNVPLYAGDWQTFNEIFGVTNNPWDLNLTPGGSTGGGAAAVAAGLSYLSLGSDIGGSIRIPSSFCGIFGHKPTINILPYRGHIPRRHSPLLTVAGTLTRQPEDLKTALEVIGGPEEESAIAYSWSLPPSRHNSLSEYRLGYVLDHPSFPVDEKVKQGISKAVNQLEGNVAVLDEGWPKEVDPVEQWRTYRFLISTVYSSYMKDEDFEKLRERAKNQDDSRDAFTSLAWTAPHKVFQKALDDRMRARASWQKYFETYDAFILPVAFTNAFPHDRSIPQWHRKISTPSGLREYEDFYFWISFATYTGLPATVAPLIQSEDNLPTGIQIMGPYLEDATPIDIAIKTKDLFGGYKPPSGY